MDGELIAVEQSTAQHSLDLIKTNDVLENENQQATLVVKQILHNKPNPVMIKNKKTGESKRHLEYEDWIALGNAYGVTVKTRAEPVEVFEAKGFKGYASVIRVFDGVEIGGAESYCLDNEKAWEKRDYFQMSSMAQTRAGSKALSNALRGVVALDKSLNGTPAEEMSGIDNNDQSKQPAQRPPKPAPKPNNGQNSNLGNKPKAPKAPSKPKQDEAIEVEYEVQDLSGDKPSMSLKEIIDSNPNIRAAVDELQAQGTTPNRDNIKAKLLDFNEMGKLTMDEYKQCKELLE